MEPIEPFVESGFPTSNRGRRKVTKKGSSKVSFSSRVRSAESDAAAEVGAGELSTLSDSDEGLEELLDDVHEIGEQLKEHPSLSLVQGYKRAVRDFISYIVKNTLAIEQHESGPQVLKRKRFTLITVIDQKLERLAAGILQDQRSQLDILRQVDEIAGLLIDLRS